jgi:phage terminase small subunit
VTKPAPKKKEPRIPVFVKQGEIAHQKRVKAMKAAGKNKRKGQGKSMPEPDDAKVNADRLSPRKLTFVEEYAKDFHTARAAIAAGYKITNGKTPSCVYRLLERGDIRNAIAVAQRDLARRAGVTRDNVLRETAAIAFSDVRKLFDEKGNLLPVREWPSYVAPAVAGIEVMILKGKDGSETTLKVAKIKLWDKNSALEKLLKHLGMDPSNEDPFTQLMTAIAEHPNGGGRLLPAPT